jgi:hypothetical protein
MKAIHLRTRSLLVMRHLGPANLTIVYQPQVGEALLMVRVILRQALLAKEKRRLYQLLKRVTPPSRD